jgi:hypothetical protein
MHARALRLGSAAGLSCGAAALSAGARRREAGGNAGELPPGHRGRGRVLARSFYRRLFWEAGAIGQVLYLEAEAAGVRATGIGCFFDDPVHQVFGLRSLEFQSLYHFTVGGYVDDPRLTTLPPYRRERS